MKRINTKQIQRLVENRVRNFLKESNYDDYEYFWPDGTGGYDINPYPYGSEISNAYDDGKEAQMNYDWEHMDNINDKYKAEKFSPALAPHYNHNVEDGREEAEAYVNPYMNESHLKKVIRKNVRKALNEEYCWWGDTKPIEEIMSACAKIVKGKNEDDFEYPDDRASYDLYKWANRVYEEAEEYLRYNAHNVSINGGEDW